MTGPLHRDDQLFSADGVACAVTGCRERRAVRVQCSWPDPSGEDSVTTLDPSVSARPDERTGVRVTAKPGVRATVRAYVENRPPLPWKA